MADRPAAGIYLARWFLELERGQRTVNTFDSLWRAACWEAHAMEAEPGSSSWRASVDRAYQAMLAGERAP
jgi:hypothetical protein